MTLVIRKGLTLQKPTGSCALFTAKQYIPAVIGEAFGGGYFAGYISHTANRSPTHALIVAPRATGATGTGYTLTTMNVWRTATGNISGSTSTFDGVANTADIVTAGIADHPAAQFCKNLTIGGFSDWYLPSRYELDIAYFNLKPTTGSNSTSWGINDYSVPKREVNNSLLYPAQTALTSFNTSSEAFIGDEHWSSTNAASGAWTVSFASGMHQISGRGNTRRVRAFRRIAL